MAENTFGDFIQGLGDIALGVGAGFGKDPNKAALAGSALQSRLGRRAAVEENRQKRLERLRALEGDQVDAELLRARNLGIGLRQTTGLSGEALKKLAESKEGVSSILRGIGVSLEQNSGGRLGAASAMAEFLAGAETGLSPGEKTRQEAEAKAGAVEGLGGTQAQQIQAAGGGAPQTTLLQQAQQAQSALDFIATLSPGQQTAMLQKMKFTGPRGPELLQLLAARQDMTKAGMEGTPDFTDLNGRIQKLATQTGTVIRFGKDGRVEITQGAPVGGEVAGGLAQSMTGGQIFPVDQQLSLAQSNKERIDELIERTKTNPEDFGLFASVRSFGQNIVSLAADGAVILSNALGEEVTSEDVLNDFAEALGVDSVFDPDVAAIETTERSLAADLWKLRIARGGLKGRSNKQVFQGAVDDTRLKGFTQTSDRIAARLRDVRREFQEEEIRIRTGLGGSSNAPIEGVSDEDLIKELEDFIRQLRESGSGGP